MSLFRVVASLALGLLVMGTLAFLAGCSPAFTPPPVIPTAQAPPCKPGELIGGGIVETPLGRRFVFVGCKTDVPKP